MLIQINCESLYKQFFKFIGHQLIDYEKISTILKRIHSISRFTMVTDLFLAQDGIAEGDAIIIDMEGSTLSHLARVNIIAMKKFMFYIQVISSQSSSIY